MGLLRYSRHSTNRTCPTTAYSTASDPGPTLSLLLPQKQQSLEQGGHGQIGQFDLPTDSTSAYPVGHST